MRNIIWILTAAILQLHLWSGGVCAQQQSEWQVFTDSTAPGIFDLYEGDETMALDGAGNAWVIFSNSNLDSSHVSVGKFDGVNWTHFQAGKNGLMDGEVYHINRDHAGDIWVCGDSGISKFSQGVWNTYSIQDRFSAMRRYQAIAADSSGNIWVACLSRVLDHYISGIPLDTNVPEVFRFDGESFTPFPIRVWYPEGWDGISTISVSPSGVVWAAGAQPIDSSAHLAVAGLWRLDGGTWTAINLDNGFDTTMWSAASSVHADGNGGVWVAMYPYTANFPAFSVNYFDGTNWDPSILTGTRFGDVWLGPNGDEYFRSNGGLIVARNGKVLDSIPAAEIPFYPISGVEVASNGNIWMCSPYSTNMILETSSLASGVASPINASNKITLSVYPNPILADAAHISLRGTRSGVYRITLCNTLGVVLKTASVSAEANASSQYDLFTSDLASGAYLITIANGAERVTVPVVKK